jgi:hypothetical protein
MLRIFIQLRLIPFLGLLAFSAISHGQIQLNAGLGITNYSGDLGGSFSKDNPAFSELNLKSTKTAVQFGMKGFLTPSIALRGQLFAGRVAGDDANTDNVERLNRNLNFFSPIYGAGVAIEWNFKIGSNAFRRFGLMAGVEYFTFNPKTSYQGNVVELQPLGTEGQYYMNDRLPYSLNATSLVLGFSYQFLVLPRGGLALEFQSKYTSTDYLDDVSTTYVDKTALAASNGQIAADLSDRSLGILPGNTAPGAIRGNPNSKDTYGFLMITWSYWLGDKRNFKAASSGSGNGIGGNKRRCFNF